MTKKCILENSQCALGAASDLLKDNDVICAVGQFAETGVNRWVRQTFMRT